MDFKPYYHENVATGVLDQSITTLKLYVLGHKLSQKVTFRVTYLKGLMSTDN